MKKSVKDNPYATVLMCTYNAHDFIEKQLVSLIKQSYKYLHIIIYDDASTDDTVEIIQSIIMKYRKEEMIKLIINPYNSGGAKENFRNIINDYSSEEYIFFSDQDDIWELNKIEIMMNRMWELELRQNKPYLICHNCFLSNEKDEIIGQREIKSTNFYDLIFRPQIQGCCMLLNQKAVQLLQNKAVDWYMHDWYISLIVALKGEIVILEEKLIQYRQHANNQIGCPELKLGERVKKIIRDKQKVENYSKALKQLYSISKTENNDFFSAYAKYYKLNKKMSMIRLFYQYGVLPLNIQGLYKGYIILKTKNK